MTVHGFLRLLFAFFQPLHTFSVENSFYPALPYLPVVHVEKSSLQLKKAFFVSAVHKVQRHILLRESEVAVYIGPYMLQILFFQLLAVIPDEEYRTWTPEAGGVFPKVGKHTGVVLSELSAENEYKYVVLLRGKFFLPVLKPEHIRAVARQVNEAVKGICVFRRFSGNIRPLSHLCGFFTKETVYDAGLSGARLSHKCDFRVGILRHRKLLKYFLEFFFQSH